jgi:brefeldin A-inhibited guanine nucleotide-exchange protein
VLPAAAAAAAAETETTTFTDCVNCLIAFTNNPHSMEVALNATAFLRYCATKLAEGAIGELPDALPGGVVEAERLAPTRVVRFLVAGGGGVVLSM